MLGSSSSISLLPLRLLLACHVSSSCGLEGPRSKSPALQVADRSSSGIAHSNENTNPQVPTASVRQTRAETDCGGSCNQSHTSVVQPVPAFGQSGFFDYFFFTSCSGFQDYGRPDPEAALCALKRLFLSYFLAFISWLEYIVSI